jgi:hypothetical protein
MTLERMGLRSQLPHILALVTTHVALSSCTLPTCDTIERGEILRLQPQGDRA